VRLVFRVLLELLADMLDEFSRLVEIRVVGDTDRYLVDYPVAAHALDSAEFAEWNGVQRSSVTPQLNRA
jgi:hypothetical protein